MAKFDIDTVRHSSAHLMAQAIMRLYPDKNVQLGIGPVINNGFYYDIDLDERIHDEDLPKIEAKMKEIIKEDLPIERHVWTKEEAIKYYKEQEQPLKVELIEGFPEDEEVTYYTQGEFLDLCSGPHVERTGQLYPHFNLTHVAGAYWRGDSSRPMLQRIYAVSFADKKQLKEYHRFVEEAQKRDHRKLGKELELFHFEPVAPGSPFFMPKGALVYNELVDYIRRIYRHYDYKEVITPQILDTDLWHTSGHYENYHENMYFTPIDDRDFAVKPMNCPCHMLMFRHYKYSYRDLPLRYADFGRLHRYEKSGTLAGLTRVRTFCQDDAHIFLPMEKIKDEIVSLMEMFSVTYEHIGFSDMTINLSTRPEKKVGDDATWDIAESALKEALDAIGRPYEIKEGDGAFYGPKIDIEIADALKRYHQLGTIQLDFQLPDRFNLNYINQNGEQERPVVIHRALLGSLERFFGVYLEHIAGAFPFWLAPEQAVIVPVNENNHLEFCKKLEKRFFDEGLRVRVDDRNETMGFKTRQIQKAKIPFMLVVGDKEMESNTLSVRKYGEKYSKSMPIDEVSAVFAELKAQNMPEKFRN